MWVRHFSDVEDLQQELSTFKETYNQRLTERLGAAYRRSPVARLRSRRWRDYTHSFYTTTRQRMTSPGNAELPSATDGVRTERSVGSALRTASRFVALGLASVYVAGFMVVTSYQASLGIIEFALVRPRIIAAGLGLAILAGVPLTATFRWFRLFGFQDIGGVTLFAGSAWRFAFDNFTNVHAGAASALAVVLYTYWMWMLSAFLVGIILPGTVATMIDWASVAVGASLLSIRLIARPFFRWPRLTVAVLGTVASAIYLFGAAYRRDTFWLALWFLTVGFSFTTLRTQAEHHSWRTYPYELALLPLSLALFVYSEFIYPRLKPEFGGGRPAEVVLFLRSSGEVTNGLRQQLDAELIDETELGYYIRPRTSTSVYFLPRTEVSTIRFNRR